jgi:two-component SAPR family response regulator
MKSSLRCYNDFRGALVFNVQLHREEICGGAESKSFRKFTVKGQCSRVKDLEARRVQELLAYLLVFRNRPHPRELLCETLWGNQPSASSRKCLRQTLWRLQSAMQVDKHATELLLWIDKDWIQINTPGHVWLDIEEIEKVFKLVRQERLGWPA